MYLNELSINEKIGQKFIFGVNSHNIDEIINLIENYYIGGVILYKKNYNTYNEMLSVIKRLKKANSKNKIPLFIAIDQEGGRVNRMPSEFKNLNSVYDMSYVDKELIYANGVVTGKMLSQMGINMNFAPVLDIDDECSKVLYRRCFYGDIDDVSECGKKYLSGISQSNIISVIKHFPGHGVSRMDSHFVTPYIFNYKNVLDRHIKPFEKLIGNGVDAIMVNHLVIRKVTDGLPASISSKFISEYIRGKCKFNGLVITDEINMLSKNIFYKFSYMKRAILSGGDIVLVKLNDSGSKVIEKFVDLVENNEFYQKMIDDSINRIILVKEKYNINDDISYDGCNIDDINSQINEINNKCLSKIDK